MSYFEFIIVAITTVVAISIVISSIRVGISPLPSSARARKAIMGLLDDVEGKRIVELGSGWGNLLLAIARRYPDKEIIGYELSPFPYIVSVLFKTLFRLDNIKLHRSDFLQADLSGADILVCYLYPDGMKKLKRKLVADGVSPMIVSNTFALDGVFPSCVVRISDLYNTPVYVYKALSLSSSGDDC